MNKLNKLNIGDAVEVDDPSYNINVVRGLDDELYECSIELDELNLPYDAKGVVIATCRGRLDEHFPTHPSQVKQWDEYNDTIIKVGKELFYIHSNQLSKIKKVKTLTKAEIYETFNIPLDVELEIGD